MSVHCAGFLISNSDLADWMKRHLDDEDPDPCVVFFVAYQLIEKELGQPEYAALHLCPMTPGLYPFGKQVFLVTRNVAVASGVRVKPATAMIPEEEMIAKWLEERHVTYTFCKGLSMDAV